MIYRDPRQMARHKELGSVTVVFSHPDTSEAQEWAKQHGLPAKTWDVARQRVHVYGRFIPLALALEKAPKEIMDQKCLQWSQRGGK